MQYIMRKNLDILMLIILGTALFTFEVSSETARTKEEVLRIADRVIGERFVPAQGRPIKGFDGGEILYAHGSGYVVHLAFSTRGELVALRLFPEAFVYGKGWEAVPHDAALSPTELRWLIEAANALRPVGEVKFATSPATGDCIESGANNYCFAVYESASVNHYWRNEHATPDKAVLKTIEIGYTNPVAGKIERIRSVEDEDQDLDLKVGRAWYRVHVQEVDGNRFVVQVVQNGKLERITLGKGSIVHLLTLGCTEGTDEVCSAGFADPATK